MWPDLLFTNSLHPSNWAWAILQSIAWKPEKPAAVTGAKKKNVCLPHFSDFLFSSNITNTNYFVLVCYKNTLAFPAIMWWNVENLNGKWNCSSRLSRKTRSWAVSSPCCQRTLLKMELTSSPPLKVIRLFECGSEKPDCFSWAGRWQNVLSFPLPCQAKGIRSTECSGIPRWTAFSGTESLAFLTPVMLFGCRRR